LLVVIIAFISYATQMRHSPSEKLPRGAVTTLEADDLEELSPTEHRELQASVDSTCLLSCSYDFNSVCKQNSFVAVSLTKAVHEKYCPKGKPCHCRTIAGPMWKGIEFRSELKKAVANVKDLCSRKTICKKDKRFVAFQDTYFTYAFLKSLKVNEKKLSLLLIHFLKKEE